MREAKVNFALGDGGEARIPLNPVKGGLPKKACVLKTFLPKILMRALIVVWKIWRNTETELQIHHAECWCLSCHKAGFEGVFDLKDFP